MAELNKKDVKSNLYSYTELKTAIQDFNSNNELRSGGFGIVYKVRKFSIAFKIHTSNIFYKLKISFPL